VSDAKRLSTLLKDLAEHPSAPVLNMLLLRSMKQATYDIVNIGHFGLASPAYLHFTSPIRRYPDLVVHRGVHAALLGEKQAGKEDLGEAAHQSSVNERRSMEIEREILDLYRTKVMESRVGQKIEGMITALVGSGAYVALDDPFADVLMRFEDMGGDWELDDDGLYASSSRSGQTLKLGERLLVEVIDVSMVRRTVYGRPAGELSTQRKRRGREKHKEPKQKKHKDKHRKKHDKKRRRR
jgi:ribonuclease R